MHIRNIALFKVAYGLYEYLALGTALAFPILLRTQYDFQFVCYRKSLSGFPKSRYLPVSPLPLSRTAACLYLRYSQIYVSCIMLFFAVFLDCRPRGCPYEDSTREGQVLLHSHQYTPDTVSSRWGPPCQHILVVR